MSREKELYREVLSDVMPDFEQVRIKAKGRRLRKRLREQLSGADGFQFSAL